MKIKKMLTGILVCATLLVSTNYSHASAEQEVKPYMKVYDSKGKLEKSFSDKEIKKLMVDAKDEQTSLAVILSSTYRYSATTFGYNVYLNGGAYFYNPQDITINPAKRVVSMAIALRKSDGTYRSMYLGGFESGIHVPLDSLRSGSGKYKVQLINRTNGDSSISLNAGTLYYN